MTNRIFPVLMLLAILLGMSAPLPAQAQTLPPINCGDIIQVETNASLPRAEYQVQAPAGTLLTGRIEPVGTINIAMALYGYERVIWSRNETGAGETELINVAISSSNPDLVVAVYDSSYEDLRAATIRAYGAFTIYLGCTLRDGTVINPGDSAGGAFEGVGFPGLPSMDFTGGVTVPFMLDAPNAGGINPGFDSVFGFTLDASAGDRFDLTFMRTSGNLNLGLAVLAPDNTVVYQASLVNAERMNTLFTFPVAGQYTIGVWKMDIAAPTAPENTSFQLTGTLNP